MAANSLLADVLHLCMMGFGRTADTVDVEIAEDMNCNCAVAERVGMNLAGIDSDP